MLNAFTYSLICLFVIAITPPEAIQAKDTSGIPVRIEPVQGCQHYKEIQAIARLTAREQVTLSSKVTAYIDQMLVQPGDSIDKGQTIIELNPHPQEEKLKNAKEKLTEERRRLQALYRLVEKQAVSQSELLEQKLNVVLSENKVKALESTLENYTIRAPFFGVLSRHQLCTGWLVEAGKPLVRLINLSSLYLEFQLPSRYLSEVKEGYELTAAFTDQTQASVRAHITNIDPYIDPETLNVVLQATCDHQLSFFRPNLMANVTLIIPTEILPAIKTTSVFYKKDKAYAYKVTDDNKALLTPIAIGHYKNNDVYVLKGLTVDDYVISQGHFKVTHGNIVKNNTHSSFKK